MNARSFLLTATIAASVFAADKATMPGRTDRSAETLGWRLGVQAWSFNQFTFFDAVDKAQALGLKYIEMFPGQSVGGAMPDATTEFTMDQATRDAIKKKLADAGITLVNYGVVTPESDKDWSNLFAFARAMGIETIVSEPPADQLPRLDQLCRTAHVKLAIHNHPAPSRYWAPETVLAAVSNCSPLIGASADTGHWVRSGREPRACLDLLGRRVLGFHLKDLNKAAPDAHDVPWGTGVNNVWGILADLKTRGYRGTFSIEYEHNWDNSMPDIARCIEYFDLAAAALNDEGFAPLFSPDLKNAVIEPGGWAVKDGVLSPADNGDIWSRASFGDFILDLEFKTEKDSNSGVFLRTGDITNWLHTAIEVQILQPTVPNTRENCGGIFDVLAPARNAIKPAGEWNRYVIMARGSRIFVVLNGEQVTAIDLDQWTKAHTNPDGTPNKFDTAYKDMPRKGAIGLQYHGSKVWFRNPRVKQL